MSRKYVQQISMWLMLLTISEMLELKPFGALMCGYQCQKIKGCKSFEFNFTFLSCVLKCDLCLIGYSKMETLCRSISKNNKESLWKQNKNAKIYPMKSLKCNEVTTKTTRRSNFICNRFVYSTLYATSFYIMDLSNNSQKVEIHYRDKIVRLSDFTKTRVLLALKRPKNNLILYDIEKKTEETALNKVSVFGTARGETEGIVYVLGKEKKANSKKTVWIISNSNPIKEINVNDIYANKFEVDAHEEIMYFYRFKIAVYNIRTNSKSIIETGHLSSSMTLEHVENILYIFTHKSWSKLILPNGEIEHITDFTSDYVVRSLVNGNDFYLSFLNSDWGWDFFKITLNEKGEKVKRTLISTSPKRAYLI